MAKIHTIEFTPPQTRSDSIIFVRRDAGYAAILGCVDFTDSNESAADMFLETIQRIKIPNGHDVRSEPIAVSLARTLAPGYSMHPVINIPGAKGAGLIVVGSQPVVPEGRSYTAWEPDYTTWSAGSVRIARMALNDIEDITRNALNFNGETMQSAGVSKTVYIGSVPKDSVAGSLPAPDSLAGLMLTTMYDAEWNIGMLRDPSLAAFL
jgi:hypothetical protein